MTATEYLAQLCRHRPDNPRARRHCGECHDNDATELLALRKRQAAIDAEAPGVMRELEQLRDTLTVVNRERDSLVTRMQADEARLDWLDQEMADERFDGLALYEDAQQLCSLRAAIDALRERRESDD